MNEKPHDIVSDDDTEGHGKRSAATEPPEGDDVVGHVQPPRDTDGTR